MAQSGYLTGYRSGGVRQASDYGFREASRPRGVNPKIEDLMRGRLTQKGSKVPQIKTPRQPAKPVYVPGHAKFWPTAKRNLPAIMNRISPAFRAGNILMKIYQFPDEGGTFFESNAYWNKMTGPIDYPSYNEADVSITPEFWPYDGGVIWGQYTTPYPLTFQVPISWANFGVYARHWFDPYFTAQVYWFQATGVPAPYPGAQTNPITTKAPRTLVPDYWMQPTPVPVPWALVPYVGTSELPDGDVRTNDLSPKPQPQREIVRSPNGTTTRPNAYTQAPPPRGVKERKVLARVGGLAGAALSGATEFRDFVGSFWDALPKDIRKEYWQKYAPKGKPGVIPEVPILLKLEGLYRHYDKIDMKEAFINLAKNQMEDALIGGMSRRTIEELRKAGWKQPWSPFVGPGL